MINFFNKFTESKNREEKVSIIENTQEFKKMFSELVKKSNEETIKKTIKFMDNEIQGELLSKCFYNDRNYRQYMDMIEKSLTLDLEMDAFQKCNIVVDIAETPVISCVWNFERVKEALYHLGKCNNNPFDGKTYSGNIMAYLIEPLGVVLVINGNHSVNAAIVQQEGEIIVETKVDISSALDKYNFNGEDYIDIITGEKIEHTMLKNGSQPFTYTLGLMFEMARVLKENRMEER